MSLFISPDCSAWLGVLWFDTAVPASSVGPPVSAVLLLSNKPGGARVTISLNDKVIENINLLFRDH